MESALNLILEYLLLSSVSANTSCVNMPHNPLLFVTLVDTESFATKQLAKLRNIGKRKRKHALTKTVLFFSSLPYLKRKPLFWNVSVFWVLKRRAYNRGSIKQEEFSCRKTETIRKWYATRNRIRQVHWGIGKKCTFPADFDWPCN